MVEESPCFGSRYFNIKCCSLADSGDLPERLLINLSGRSPLSGTISNGRSVEVKRSLKNMKRFSYKFVSWAYPLKKQHWHIFTILSIIIKFLTHSIENYGWLYIFIFFLTFSILLIHAWFVLNSLIIFWCKNMWK